MIFLYFDQDLNILDIFLARFYITLKKFWSNFEAVYFTKL